MYYNNIPFILNLNNWQKSQDFKNVMKKGGDQSDMKEVKVTGEMSRDDVVNGILEKIHWGE